MNDKRRLAGTSASTQTTGTPAAMAVLIGGTSALGSQPTTIMPAGLRAVVCSMAATKPGISTELGPATVTLTPSSSPASRSAGWSWVVNSARFALADSQTYSSLGFAGLAPLERGAAGEADSGFSQPANAPRAVAPVLREASLSN